MTTAVAGKVASMVTCLLNLCVRRASDALSERQHRHDDTYDLERVLTHGTGGECFVMRSRRTGELTVHKYVAHRSRTSYELAAHVRWLKTHANVVEVLGSFHERGLPVLVLAYCSGGDLQQQMNHFMHVSDARRRRVTPEAFVLHVFISLVQALAYVHHGVLVSGSSAAAMSFATTRRHTAIVHGDIKPANIFLNWTATPQHPGLPDVVLADFGLCQPAKKSFGIFGTPTYMAPEVERVLNLRHTNPLLYHLHEDDKDIVTRPADVYSVGLCVLRLAGDNQFETGRHPTAIRPKVLGGDIATTALQTCLAVEQSRRIKMDIGIEGMLERFLSGLYDLREAKYQTVDDALWAAPPVR